MKLLFSPAARDDLVRLREFIRIHNLDAAERAAQIIVQNLHTLCMFPALGRAVRNSNEYRDFAFVFGAGSYVLRYKVTHDTLRILRIWHSR
jgi:plasmid stabilization system protein ParE